MLGPERTNHAAASAATFVFNKRSSGGGGIGGGGSSFFQPAGRALEIALKVNLAAISNFYLFIL
jgi:hypothetical protein